MKNTFEQLYKKIINENYIDETTLEERKTDHEIIEESVNKKLINEGILRSLTSFIQSSNFSVDEMKRLSENSDEEIREAIANNPNCPPQILDYLSYDSCGHVKYAVVNNPNTLYHTLRHLENDHDICIYSAARRRTRKSWE